MERGIITSPVTVGLDTDGFSLQSRITPEDIRFYTLYWDKIIMPTNFLLHVTVPDEGDLVGCGVITRPAIQLHGSFKGNELGMAIIKGQCEIANKKMNDLETDWVLHQPGAQLYLPQELSSQNNVIRVDLAGALPVPGKDVGIHEILEFKEKRSDELEALHKALDDVYLEVLQSPDPSLATKKAFQQLKADIANLSKVSNESYNSSKKFDFSVELNLNGKDVAVAAASGAFIDSLATGFTIPIATVLSSALSVLKVSGKSTRTLTHSENKTKLSYLSSATDEKIV